MCTFDEFKSNTTQLSQFYYTYKTENHAQIVGMILFLSLYDAMGWSQRGDIESTKHEKGPEWALQAIQVRLLWLHSTALFQ